MLYSIACKIWDIAKWIWLTLIIVFLIGLLANVLVVQITDLPKTVLVSVLNWLFLPGFNRTLTISIPLLFIAITLSSLVFTIIGGHIKGGKALRQYLRSVVEANQGLNPKGFAQQSQALISVNVPLDDIFIHLRAVPDRPVYDIPSEQQKLLAELRQRSDLKPEELEERIQKLRVIWHSQLGKELAEDGPKQNISIETVLQQLKAANSVAVILGAPGSGKSTAMRWLALHMARASLSPGYHFPKDLSPRQIPILLHTSDYAKRLSTESLSFEEFFKDLFAKVHPDLPAKLLEQLEKGCCLLLLDGLDEVASDSLRRRITENISIFISKYSAGASNVRHYNRFIVTSRIVGYEPGAFSEYAHYTLLDLADEEIEQFLTNWCPAVERYQAMFAQGMKKLTSPQEVSTEKAGLEQRDRLLHVLNDNPSIKRLAVNPLMLTILALIQRSGRTLPHRRIELYQVVTRTLLDNWNQETGRKVFTIEEIPLAERLLIDLAYRLHTSDPVLLEQDVLEIARRVMAEFYEHAPKDSDIQKFIDILRSSSGLFVESGQGLFSFMHRTFQEYFVALYLIQKPLEDLKEFVVEHYSTAIWREPLLLAIAYKSGKSSRQEQKEASDLIKAIINVNNNYDTILHRNLLFGANGIVDCSAWSIDKDLQHSIANSLFDLYGDPLGRGRYSQLQQDIENVALLWLRGQPQDTSQQATWPPLLEAWRTAMNNVNHSARQKGAVHLLVTIAPDLPRCPSLVLLALVPLLLQLSGLKDLPCQSDTIIDLLPELNARPSSSEVEEYAFFALYLLGATGPAGWLHAAWLKWDEKQPELLERLTKHSLELNYLLTPAALPSELDSANRDLMFKVANRWQMHGRRNPHKLQSQLLHATDRARYPYGYLLWQLLKNEEVEASLPWHVAWDKFLQKEMGRGRGFIYQECLNLRLLLCEKNGQQPEEIASELMTALATPDRQQLQALIAITHILQYPDIHLDVWWADGYSLFRAVKPNSYASVGRIASYPSYIGNNPYFLKMYYLNIFGKFIEIYNIAAMQSREDRLDQYSVQDGWDIRFPRFLQYLQYMRYCMKFFDISDLFDGYLFKYIKVEWGVKMITGRTLNKLEKCLEKDAITNILSNILLQQTNAHVTIILPFLQYFLVTYSSMPLPLKQKIRDSVQKIEQQAQTISIEHHLLITAIRQQISDTPQPQSQPVPLSQLGSPDSRVEALNKFKQHGQLTKLQVEEMLIACTDTREISLDITLKIMREDSLHRRLNTVGQFAWTLLSQQFSLELEALHFIVQCLDNDNAIICAAAALLLQYSKMLPESVRKNAIEKIMKMLGDDELSNRPLNPPDSSRFWWLGDVMFETLKALVK